MSLCISENVVPSSTFWLVAGILFIAILVIFELVTKTKLETDLFNQGVNSRFSNNSKDINALYARLFELEKKCGEKCEKTKKESKKESKKEPKIEPGSESGSETGSESGSESEIEE